MTKNSSWPVTGLGNKGPLKVLNGIKLILDDRGNNLDSFRIILVLQGSPQTSKWSGTIFCRFLQQTGSRSCIFYFCSHSNFIWIKIKGFITVSIPPSFLAWSPPWLHAPSINKNIQIRKWKEFGNRLRQDKAMKFS